MKCISDDIKSRIKFLNFNEIDYIFKKIDCKIISAECGNVVHNIIYIHVLRRIYNKICENDNVLTPD